MSFQEAKPVHENAGVAFVSPPLFSEVCGNLELVLPKMTEIYRYLGYPRGTSPGPQIAELAQRIIRQSLSYLVPRATFSGYPVTARKKGQLCMGDVTVRGDVAEYMEAAERVAVFVVTVGEEISTHSARLRQGGDALAAWIVDGLGSWAAEAAADALAEHIRHHLRDDEEMTLRYSPGYCGMEMAQQRELFSLVNAGSVGVRLLPSLIMQPLKSISGVIGLGPKQAIRTYRSACDRCPQAGCHMRR